MKNPNWLSAIRDRLTQSPNRKSRRRAARISGKNFSFERLEDKNLLATVGFDSGSGLLSFTSDAGEVDIVNVSLVADNTYEIQVGNGDEIALEGDAAGNGDFVLSQTNTANDTLQIDVSGSVVSDFVVNLGDQDDTFTISDLPGLSSLVINGEGGNDNIDASGINIGVTLIGGGGNDTLTGGDQDDTLIGGGGTDIIDGGAGIDTNSFQGIGIGVTATVAADGTGTADYGSVNETFTGIENLTGSDNDDVLIATGAAANTLIGGDGNDILAGGGGTDIIDGGAGIDTNSFEGIGFGVTATVAADGSGTADYGPVSETFTGIENLTGSDNDDVLIATGAAANTLIGGAGNDILAGGGGTDIIDGGEGIDTNSFQGIGIGVTATVAADGTGTADYGAVNETFSGIENLTGSDNDDVLIATGAAANTLIGGAGNDILAGGGGTDIIDGGEGIDTNSFQGIGIGVTATVAADGTGTADYGAVNETFTGIENLTGSDNDDVLIATGAAANTLIGGAGNDLLAGGGGTDIIDGGEGIDTNSFQGIGVGVTATVAADGTGTADYGAVNETFTGIENLTGSDNDDVLIATGAAANTLIGGAGNDILAGGGGTDIIDGGEGIDTNSFQGIGVGVTATVTADGTGTADYGAVNETFTGIENLTGSDNDDVLTATGDVGSTLLGSGGDDVLTGGTGNDVIDGGDGNDILRGGQGNDELSGGLGNDALNGAAGSDILSGGDGDDFLIGIGGTDTIDGGEGIDTNSFQGIGSSVTATVDADGNGTAVYGQVNESFTGIENLIGSDNDDVLTATGVADNVLRGLGGNDVITAGEGNDLLVGNEGADILRGGSGDDIALGGIGNDSLNGGGGNDRLDGAEGDDFFVGIGGTDTIIGGEGIDTNSFQGIGSGVTARINDSGTGTASYGQIVEIFTGIENLVGSSNDDVLVATGNRSTVLRGLGGNDVLIGGGGNDFLLGDDGADVLLGGVGFDIIRGGQGADNIEGGTGEDLLFGDEGADRISGGGDDDRIEGGDGADNLFGNEGLDLIFGGLGNDGLFGGEDDDDLRGEEGDDLLIGGLGNDFLLGGLGNDEEIQ